MANYAIHDYEVFAEIPILDQLEKEIRSWDGDITIERLRREGPLTFCYPMKYIHDFKSFKDLSTRYPNAEFHINVRMDEGPETYYVALRGTFASVNIDTRIKQGIHALLSEIFHRDLFDREIFETIIMAFEDDTIPWFDAAFRLILSMDKGIPRIGDKRICPSCVKKFYKSQDEKDLDNPTEHTGTENNEIMDSLPF